MADYATETTAILTDFQNGDYSKVANISVKGDLNSLLMNDEVVAGITIAAKKAKNEGYTLERFVSDVVVIGYREGLKPA